MTIMRSWMKLSEEASRIWRGSTVEERVFCNYRVKLEEALVRGHSPFV